MYFTMFTASSCGGRLAFLGPACSTKNSQITCPQTSEAPGRLRASAPRPPLQKHPRPLPPHGPTDRLLSGLIPCPRHSACNTLIKSFILCHELAVLMSNWMADALRSNRCPKTHTKLTCCARSGLGRVRAQVVASRGENEAGAASAVSHATDVNSATASAWHCTQTRPSSLDRPAQQCRQLAQIGHSSVSGGPASSATDPASGSNIRTQPRPISVLLG